jgi:hypothetical protein
VTLVLPAVKEILVTRVILEILATLEILAILVRLVTRVRLVLITAIPFGGLVEPLVIRLLDITYRMLLVRQLL